VPGSEEACVEHCCNANASELDVLWSRQSRILRTVLAINALMFIVEAAAGLLAGSAALLGDSLDMLGDALVYGVSLAVIGRSPRARAGAAAMKGTAMLLFGIAVLADVGYKLYTQRTPDAALMSITAAIALAANSICLVLLTRHRADDINMRSAWICSRNDLAANIGVLLAAAGVFFTRSIWPDILVGLAITALFLRSSVHVLRQATNELRATPAALLTTETSGSPPLTGGVRGG
jgi:Co/Zn/Cd efflux system component